VHDLVAITALGGSEPRVETVGAVTCTEVPGIALASVAARLGKESQTSKALGDLIGSPVPGVNQFAGSTLTAIWAGPEQWMIEAPFDTHEEIAGQVKSAIGDTASVTEQTDAWTRFDLSGPEIPAVLELLCQLDLRKIGAGSAMRCSIHHVGCFVLCRSNELYSLYGPPSSAGTLHHAIITAMRSAL